MKTTQKNSDNVFKIVRVRLENSEALFLEGCRLLLDAEKELELLDMSERG